MATLPSLITFGSLTPLPSQDQILQLQEEFHKKGILFEPLIKAVRNLDSLWTKTRDQDPVLSVIDGKAAVRKLEGLLSGKVNEQISVERHNVLIVPVTILNHLISNKGNAESATLAVRWKDTRKLEDIQKILLCRHNTYIAATRDERDITITTPAEAVTVLQEDLLRNDVSFLAIGLNGRHHTDRHADIPSKIIKACEGPTHRQSLRAFVYTCDWRRYYHTVDEGSTPRC
ncbi:hypothetical protein F5Y12DRAFT_712008 [Xylaria sp. FL1777]|nr:hypothetical protein F5Y12DRAFT_712008 [Xylaria sp. FL1777]